MPRGLVANVLAALLILAGCDTPPPVACDKVTCTHGTCVARNGVPACVCSAEELQAGLSCQLQTDVPRSGEREVRSLEMGAPVSDTFDVEHAIHPFVAQLTPGEVYRLTCVPVGGECAIEVRVENVLIEGDAPYTGKTAEVIFVARSAADHEVSVSGGGSQPYPYQLTLEQMPDLEGGNLAEATPIAIDTPYDGRLEVEGDRDFFRVDPATHGWFRFEVNADSGARVDRYGPDGDPIPWYYGPDQWMAAGAHYLSVTGGRGAYRLQVIRTGTDDHPELAELATLLSEGTEIEGQIDRSGDVDRFAFTGIAPHVYQPRCEVLEGSGCGVPLGVEVLDDGLHSFTVEGPPGLRYRISIVDVGIDDHSDTASGATVVGPGTLSLRYDYDHDVDVVAFDLAPNWTLFTPGFSIMEPEPDTYESLYPYNFVAAGDTPLRVFLEMNRWDDCLVCERTLVVRGPDLVGDTPEEALPSAYPLHVTGELESLRDRDAFQFEVTTAAVHQASCGSPTEEWLWIVCYLQDASGTTLARIGYPVTEGPVAVSLEPGTYTMMATVYRSGGSPDPSRPYPYELSVQ